MVRNAILRRRANARAVPNLWTRAGSCARSVRKALVREQALTPACPWGVDARYDMATSPDALGTSVDTVIHLGLSKTARRLRGYPVRRVDGGGPVFQESTNTPARA